MMPLFVKWNAPRCFIGLIQYFIFIHVFVACWLQVTELLEYIDDSQVGI